MPKTTFDNTQKVPSPLKNWPGHIIVPKELTVEDFVKWYEYQNREEDERPELLQTWSGRFHLVKEWRLDGLKPEQVEETGLKLPSMKIVMFMIAATQDLISDASSLPNLPGSSNGDGSGTPNSET